MFIDYHYSPDVIDEIESEILKRTVDKVSTNRVAACKALHRLQIPQAGLNCPVTQAYIRMLNDSSAFVSVSKLFSYNFLS